VAWAAVALFLLLVAVRLEGADVTDKAPTQTVFDARGAAWKLQTCTAPEVVLDGPVGTGKSMACLFKIHAAMALHPGARGLILRATRESLTQTGLVTFEEKVLEPDSYLAGGSRRSNRQAYYYNNGSELVVAGMVSHSHDTAHKVMSAEYDIAYVQQAEELVEEQWEKLSTRMRHWKMPYQQIIGDCNPAGPFHWLKKRMDRGDTVRLASRHKDNPRLWDKDRRDWTDEGRSYMARLDRLTGARLKRLRDGLWVAAEGTVYEDVYDAAVHVIDRPALPMEGFRWYVAGVDWGFTNPGVIAVFGVDGDGNMTEVAEQYHTQKRLDWWVQRAKELHGMYRLRALVCDPSEPEHIRQFQSAGLPAVEANNDIDGGIDHVAQKLSYRDQRGRPGLRFLRDAVLLKDRSLMDANQPWCLHQEFEVYMRSPATGSTLRTAGATVQRNPKERPIDAYNHGMDSLRYTVMYVSGYTYGSQVAIRHAPTPLGLGHGGNGRSAVPREGRLTQRAAMPQRSPPL